MIPGGATRPAVDDELLRVLGDLGVEVVEEHPQRRLGLPGACIERGAARRPDRAQVAAERLDESVRHASTPTCDSAASTIAPDLIASATRSMSALSERSSVSRGESSRTASCTARTPSPGVSGARNSIA